jgi:hypothetical protein
VTLAEVLGAAAAASPIPVEEEVLDDGAMGWAVRQRLVAILDGSGLAVTVRLDPVLAGAALRTPDFTTSSRGPEWVTFRPTVLDDHAIDRAEAWFAAAIRRGAAGSG